MTKVVGPSTTLAWPVWKQPDIPVEVDTARLETSRTEYWHGEGAAGLSCTELSVWEFPFLKGACRQKGNSIWYCVNGTPQKETLDNIAYTCMLSNLSTSFTSVSIFSVCCYSIYLSGPDFLFRIWTWPGAPPGRLFRRTTPPTLTCSGRSTCLRPCPSSPFGLPGTKSSKRRSCKL